jgi:hypothetical protein
MTWLVRHEGRSGELTALLKDGWSWEDISLAMPKSLSSPEQGSRLGGEGESVSCNGCGGPAAAG